MREIPVGKACLRQPVFAAPDDDQVVGGNDDRELSAAACGGVGVLREIGSTVRHKPELPSILTIVLASGWRRSARESNPAFGNDAIVVPDSVVQVKQTETREVSRIRVDLAAQDVIAESIDADDRVPHADLIEERP